MDAFVNLAKQGLEAYEKSQSGGQSQGNQSPSNQHQPDQHQPSYSGGGQEQPSYGHPHQYGGQDQGYEQQGQQGYGSQGGYGGQGGHGGQGGYSDDQQPNYQRPSGGYERPEASYGRQGGSEWNSVDNNASGGSAQEYYNPQKLNADEVGMSTASTYGHGEADASMFSNAIQHVQNHFSPQQQQAQPQHINEQHVQDAHNVAYKQGNAGSLDAGSMGSAAAMQALKMFTGGSAGGGGSQSELISLAMSEAAKLFDSAGGASSGGKQEAVNGAATTVMKLLIQSKLGGSAIGGGNSGGLSSIMGLASKFM